MNRIVHDENLDVPPGLPDRLAELMYVDRPCHTGRQQVRRPIRMMQGADAGEVTMAQPLQIEAEAMPCRA